jgi:hypothetical protein
MFNRLVMGLVMGVLLGAGGARAEDYDRVVPLEWKAGRAPGMRVARIPHATVTHKPQPGSEMRNLSIKFDDGTFCSASAGGSEALFLNCGSERGLYHFVELAGSPPQLTWVGPGAVGEKN